ncbi:hypothetical protein EV401DRAFT_2082056 [Pisolithus croceorrhizus]|nr:hypothetical protein EV401DRAFT_2082056 [Pisolithus croceorrhizus]
MSRQFRFHPYARVKPSAREIVALYDDTYDEDHTIPSSSTTSDSGMALVSGRLSSYKLSRQYRYHLYMRMKPSAREIMMYSSSASSPTMKFFISVYAIPVIRCSSDTFVPILRITAPIADLSHLLFPYTDRRHFIPADSFVFIFPRVIATPCAPFLDVILCIDIAVSCAPLLDGSFPPSHVLSLLHYAYIPGTLEYLGLQLGASSFTDCFLSDMLLCVEHLSGVNELSVQIPAEADPCALALPENSSQICLTKVKGLILRVLSSEADDTLCRWLPTFPKIEDLYLCAGTSSSDDELAHLFRSFSLSNSLGMTI